MLRISLLSITLLISLTLSAVTPPKLIPRDLPTIQALIDLHKMIARQHDATILVINQQAQDQKKTKNHTHKLKESIDIFNSKYETINNYLALLPVLLRTSREIKKFANEYADFTKKTGYGVLHMPKEKINKAKADAISTFYYFDAVYRVGQEIKSLEKEIDLLVAKEAASKSSGKNIGLLSSDNLLQIINYIDLSISRCYNIIFRANIICTYGIHIGSNHYYMWNIRNLEFTNHLAKVISDNFYKL